MKLFLPLFETGLQLDIWIKSLAQTEKVDLRAYLSKQNGLDEAT